MRRTALKLAGCAPWGHLPAATSGGRAVRSFPGHALPPSADVSLQFRHWLHSPPLRRPTPTGSGFPASAPAPPTGFVSTRPTAPKSRCTPRPRTTACSGRPTTASTGARSTPGLEGIPGAKNVRTVFTSGTTVYAGTTAGLFKSTGGGGFQPVAQGPEQDPKNPKKLNAPVQAVFTGILPGSPMLARGRQRRRLQVHRRRRDVAEAGPGQRDGGRGDRLEPRLVQGQRRDRLRGDAERHLHLDRLRLQLDAVQ